MAPETKQNYALTVATSMLAIIISLVGMGIYNLQSHISSVHQDVKELQAEIGAYNVAIAKIEANRFTSAEGILVWKELSRMEQEIASLPPENWRSRILNNEKDLIRLKALIGVEDPPWDTFNSQPKK